MKTTATHLTAFLTTAAAAFVVLASANETTTYLGSPRNLDTYGFDDFVSEHDKKYSDETERSFRETIFGKNLAIVRMHNARFLNGETTWFMDVNHLADMTTAEFAAIRGTYTPLPSSETSSLRGLDLNSFVASNPKSVDWRTKGVVTDVKNQGGCGSCWAFSATETVESHYAIASGKLVELAPQTYVNCVENPNECGGTGGCEGATMELAFNLTKESGIALEEDLPYRGEDETCGKYKAAVTCSGYVKNPTNDASALETAIASKGPVSVTVAAMPWQLYGGGVFDGCSSGFTKSSDLDHGVQAVGYSPDYWIVRNSWGAGWGEKGYIRISRANDDKTFEDTSPQDGVACKPYPKSQTVGGECGILFDTSYPTGVEVAA